MLADMSSIRDIVRSAGGPTEIARASLATQKPVTVDAVFKWYRNGIPDEHWKLIMTLTRVSVETLFDANRELDPERVRVRRRRKRLGNESRAAA